MDIPPPLNRKYQTLQALLAGYDRVAIAFSGGVDSTLLLRIGHDTLGQDIVSLFADSVFQPEEERQGALATARAIGVELVLVDFLPLSLPELAANPAERCYHCKKAIFSTFIDLAGQRGFPWLLDGTNADDLHQHRPGARALAELGVKSPLAEAGLTKPEIRQLSRALGLLTWEKHSASCLATRIPAGTPITAASLVLVDQAERFLHSLGYHGCRVRLLGETWTIELAAGDIARMAGQGDFSPVRDAFHSMGAKKVLLDLLERAGILS